MRSTIVEFGNHLLSLLLALLPWALCCVWWLFAVNWRKAWAMIDARPCNCLGFLVVPNGWWQLGYLSTLAALALVSGWMQGQFAWTPPEIRTEPPPEAHDHQDAHAHH